ncbi:MAG TPA: citrate/2-methylcitrate synthase [Planctomycetota bacterium]|jgi:citrate synthase|nr:citrate/2-methylcitrate synthase [Planctomycetota bacterium]
MTIPSGLREVVAGRTGLCSIDGARGRLFYRGYDAVVLGERCSFEEVVHLLWEGELPTRAQLSSLRDRLASARTLPPAVLDVLRRGAKGADPMDVLRTAVSAFSLDDPDPNDRSPAANRRKAERLLAGTPCAIAAFERLRSGRAPVEPDHALGHAASFLHLLPGHRPDALHERVLDACLVLHAEHSFNASTFAARVTASTLSDLHSAAVTGVGTLKGPLHGGANREVMGMLESIGEPGRVEAWLREAVASGRRIPGFGHAVYKVDDPRAALLRRLSKELAEAAGEPRWHAISVALEPLVKRWKPLPVNVDFYSASVYRYLGVPTDLFPTMFAAARLAGWAAHFFEQVADNRLIRPEAEYDGPPERPFVPIEERRG